jgi:hypothetical protein
MTCSRFTHGGFNTAFGLMNKNFSRPVQTQLSQTSAAIAVELITPHTINKNNVARD